MKKLYTSVKLLGLAVSLSFYQNANAQFTVDFESLQIPVDSFWNNSNAAGPYVEDNVTFGIEYDSTYSSWAGFSISTMRDDTTAGLANQYSSYSGTPQSGDAYAVFFPGYGDQKFAEYQYDVQFGGVWVNNSSYAGISMRDGDQFAKQFGSPNGVDGQPDGTNGEDWFLLSIYTYDADDNQLDSTGFYLADYRFPNAQDDYIIDEWTYIDLSQLQVGRKLGFSLSSSDVGQFGMNTPSYFVLDNLTINGTLAISEQDQPEMKMYPNPATDQIHLQGVQVDYVEIIDLSGKKVKRTSGNSIELIQISDLDQGIYLVHAYKNSKLVGNQKLIKQ